MEAGFACGSMVLLFLFHKTFCTLCKMFCEKDLKSSALPEAKMPFA